MKKRRPRSPFFDNLLLFKYIKFAGQIIGKDHHDACGQFDRLIGKMQDVYKKE